MRIFARPVSLALAAALLAGAAGAGPSEYVYRHQLPTAIPVKAAPAEEGAARLALPASVVLATVTAGQGTGACTDVQLRNVGDGDAGGLAASLSGTDASAFEFCDPSAGACGTALGAGGACAVGLRLAAASEGGYAAVLTIAAGAASASAPISGDVVAPPAGSIFGIGANDYGQLRGSGPKAAWTAVDEDGSWMSIAAGGQHGYAIRSDGSIWGIGYNDYGQVGGKGHRSAWGRIGTENDWATIAAGNNHGYALKRDGSIWGIGYNNAGQIGGSGNKSSWTRIGPDNDWVAIAAGYQHGYAIKRDGSIWGIGYNIYGQIGGSGDKTGWVRIGTEGGWRAVTGGLYHGYALK